MDEETDHGSETDSPGVLEPDRGDPKDESIPGVCVVTHPLGAAGENATRTLLEILAEITTISLVTANLPDDSVIRERHEIVELTTRGAGQSNVVVAAWRFLRNQLRMCVAIVRREEGIVLFFGAVSYLLPIACARLLGRTVVVQPRGDVPLTLRLEWEPRMPDLLARALAGSVWLLERIGYRLADAVITYTPSIAEELDLSAYEHKVYPHGARFVDLDEFSPRTSLEDRDRIVGFLGRIDEEKGIRTLAAVAEDLPPDVRFRFVGDGDLLPWLRGRLSDEIDAGDVELAGWVDHDEVASELNELRLLVMPSSPTEGLPTTILEALACGTPVYATPVAGVPDVVRDGETGFHMTATDPESIAEGIETALNRPDLAEIGQNGRDLAVTRFSREAAVARYRVILEDIR